MRLVGMLEFRIPIADMELTTRSNRTVFECGGRRFRSGHSRHSTASGCVGGPSINNPIGTKRKSRKTRLELRGALFPHACSQTTHQSGAVRQSLSALSARDNVGKSFSRVGERNRVSKSDPRRLSQHIA
ncbi:hypothetical protein CEXT_747631 [Caerostris extrusa]|uniref:Uncharacterized protein n=1 Tax=Caerostris extrusa TaxID=172846 RepID=A0AAV4T8E6_CAEEX|nr:hypothetical protein CEXT_747631 [Caerostris extrusa]